jgi:hypothetical protein
LAAFLGLLGVRIVLLLHGPLDLDPLHVGRPQALVQLVEPHVGLAAFEQTQQKAQEDLPLPPARGGVHPEAADRERAQHGEDVAERGVVVELQPEARGVHEDEVAGEADLQVRLERHQGARRHVEVVQRLLHGGVLHRVELEAPERGTARGAARGRPGG